MPVPVTRGYGNGSFVGSIALAVRRGFSGGLLVAIRNILLNIINQYNIQHDAVSQYDIQHEVDVEFVIDMEAKKL